MDLLQEAIALNLFDHPNLVRFYGVCISKEKRVKYILLEYMNNGDLLSFLRSHRNFKKVFYIFSFYFINAINICFIFLKQLKIKTAIKIIIDIAKACCYLEDMKFIHRDLAARNCLIHLDLFQSEANLDQSLKVKLGDFGLARELYSKSVKDYYKHINDINKLLPIRWMSPESICEGVFTTKSDVWSFGIIIWEILTLGFQPYRDMTNLQCVEYILKGGSLKLSEKCPIEM